MNLKKIGKPFSPLPPISFCRSQVIVSTSRTFILLLRSSEKNKTMTDVNVAELVRQSHEAKQKAYCPYSNFQVGAAVLTEEGTIFTGCNIENSSYSLTICAERTAVAKAVSEGYTKFKAIAVATNVSEKYMSPCGACRQFLSEFTKDSGDYDIYMSKPDLTYDKKKISELLPCAFSLN
ncbi:cytidine deaminase-like isoform X2 [Biomphalaria glabrata]|uniref:Cytidine deaminase n=1 Tax=Biomphalaria glabrata TaxID=6526 RepID=A0A9W2YM89_BIOGL|nr:cytidine deaminase-like isoform X2 [Biomphalaria glabrata]